MVACFLCAAVDIYIVSSGLNSDGSQSDPDRTHKAALAIQSVYYGLYILLLVFAFLLLPFTYFYFEGQTLRHSRRMSKLRCLARSIDSR